MLYALAVCTKKAYSGNQITEEKQDEPISQPVLHETDRTPNVLKATFLAEPIKSLKQTCEDLRKRSSRLELYADMLRFIENCFELGS